MFHNTLRRHKGKMFCNNIPEGQHEKFISDRHQKSHKLDSAQEMQRAPSAKDPQGPKRSMRSLLPLQSYTCCFQRSRMASTMA